MTPTEETYSGPDMDAAFRQHTKSYTTPINPGAPAATPVPPVKKTEWAPVGQPQTNYHKWTTAGQTISGTWAGTTEGKYGEQGVVEDGSTRYVFTLHTALGNRLRDVAPGTMVKIVYRGTDTSVKTQRTYKRFDVFTATRL